MVRETTRLRIVPLSVEQFRLLLCGMDKLEEAVKLNPSCEYLDHETQQVMSLLPETDYSGVNSREI